jgi:hypothetical protein
VSVQQKLEQLKRDIAGREDTVAESERLIAYWRRQERELEEAQAHQHHHPLPRYGVDYAWGRPGAEHLRRAGVTFAARYLTGEGKALEESEARQLSEAGIDLVAIMEAGGRDLAAGPDLMHERGQQARQAARRLKVPRHTPIYATCDFDAAGEGLTATVLHSLRGFTAALGQDYQAALYAGLDVIAAAFSEGFIHYGWQTLAWSRGQRDRRAQLYQARNGEPHVNGVECDTDYAYAADFGQFRIS